MQAYFNTIDFQNVELFWLLLIVPLYLVWYIFRHRNRFAEFKMSSTDSFSSKRFDFIKWLYHGFVGLKLIAFALLITAMARPQSTSSWQNVSTEGIDIIITLDISGSMLAEDFEPNRLEASKNVALEFIEERKNDRIGLVVYSGESFTQCPLTTDHSILKNLFRNIKNGMIEDGTAIGLGLANSVNRLKDSEVKSKVIILLTDGFNTTGAIPPLTAAEIAKTYGIRVYTIGVGTNGLAPYPFRSPFGGIQYQNVEVKIDETTLKSIAELTGGKYFRATDNEKLRAIYEEINKLETSEIEVTEYKKKKEEFFPWLLAGAAILLIEFLMRNTLFKSIVYG